MVLLDPEMLRFLTKDHFRVLQSVEQGMRNHDIVPTRLINSIARIKSSNIHTTLGELSKFRLIRHLAEPYDGYRLTYMGYDYLALKALVNKGLIKGIGRQVGVGKESDIFEVINNNDEILILKIHRLGRVCFRNIKTKRDYLGKRKHGSFMYMSRLAATREFAYLKALYDEGFPTPVPYEVNRHIILMSYVDAFPMARVGRMRHPEKVYATLMNLLVRFAEAGLVHGDFNEFNLLLSRDEEVTVIDFPQMISTNHLNAEETFQRDVDGVHRFFLKKMGMDFPDKPRFVRIERPKGGKAGANGTANLDVALKVSGALTKRETRDLDEALNDAKEMHEDSDYDADDDEEEANAWSGNDDDDDEDEDDDDDEEEEEQDEDDVAVIGGSDDNEDDDEDEDEDDDDDEGVVIRSRKHRQLNTEYDPTKLSANRRLRNLGGRYPSAQAVAATAAGVDGGIGEAEADVGAQVLLTAAQLGGLELRGDDDDDDAVDLDGIPSLGSDDDDDAAGAGASGSGSDDEGEAGGARRRRRKTTMGQAQVRARVRQAASKNIAKEKIAMGKNKRQERKTAKVMREVKQYYK